MKNIHYYIAASVIVAVLVVFAIFMLSAPQHPENESTQPTVQEETTIRENTTYIDIHRADGRNVLLYPEDLRYQAIDTECRKQIRGISGQFKCAIFPEELAAMKRNGTYVAIHFPEPTAFNTSYIVDGSPLEITIDEAVFFLDREDEPRTIYTPSPDGLGVWDTSRDRGKLRNLVTPILAPEGGWSS